MKVVSNYSNLCDYNTSTSQTDGRTDRLLAVAILRSVSGKIKYMHEHIFEFCGFMVEVYAGMTFCGYYQVCGSGSPTELITALRYVQAPSSPSAAAAAKFRLLSDGEANICRLNDSRSVIRKIMNSRCLRRWESHHLVLGPLEIYSTTVSRFSLSLSH